jgi:hypothetical protein
MLSQDAVTRSAGQRTRKQALTQSLAQHLAAM